jgi:hypothetical protein
LTLNPNDESKTPLACLQDLNLDCALPEYFMLTQKDGPDIETP